MSRIVYDRVKLGYLLGREGMRGDPFDDPEAILVQTDYDYPGLPSSFGWSIHDALRADGSIPTPQTDRSMPCDHAGTDGTVTCLDCGMTAADFIASAAAWLDDHAGATADDPGYFGRS